MSRQRKYPAPGMSIFERYLTLWGALCIAAGISLALLFPVLVQTISNIEFAKTNLPVGLLIWIMIIPMLVKWISAPCMNSSNMFAASA